MINPAWAQAGPGGGIQSLLQTPLVPMVMILGVFYILLIRPQQQKAKEHRTMLANLKRNDEVITTGGIYGKITAINEKIVTLEIAPNVRVRVDRPQVASLANPAAADDTKDKEKDKQK